MRCMKRVKLDFTSGETNYEVIDHEKEDKIKYDRSVENKKEGKDEANTKKTVNYISQSLWSRDSWKTKAIQQSSFSWKEGMENVLSKLSALPPIVHPTEIDTLRKALQEVYYGKKFILQGGDCAETFAECTSTLLDKKLKILLQMSLIISRIAKTPVVKIGRIAGQYAKPRSVAEELLNEVMVCTYRGDCVNGILAADRKPNPKRLLGAYFHSAATLNYLRSQIASGFADLCSSQHWKLDDVIPNLLRDEYRGIFEKLFNSLDFIEACENEFDKEKFSVDFFTSHEALILPYESALTREYQNRWYGTSGHFLWIGDRTRQLDHAHIEFCRGIENPIGIKIGPSSDANEIKQICQTLNPLDIPGKVVLITRFGANEVKKKLPPVIEAVKESGVKVVWQCDPMHGNTETTTNNIKTRNFANIFNELINTFEIHKNCGTHLGGVHFEMTGEDVTECIGGPQELNEMDLLLTYTTHCDPRLNYAQSMHIAFEVAKQIKMKQTTI